MRHFRPGQLRPIRGPFRGWDSVRMPSGPTLVKVRSLRRPTSVDQLLRPITDLVMGLKITVVARPARQATGEPIFDRLVRQTGAHVRASTRGAEGRGSRRRLRQHPQRRRHRDRLTPGASASRRAGRRGIHRQDLSIKPAIVAPPGVRPSNHPAPLPGARSVPLHGGTLITKDTVTQNRHHRRSWRW